MSRLFQPIQIRSLEVRNRIWIAPMCQYSCEQQDGVPTQWHLVHYGSRAVGGAGLVIVEATAVSPEGRISPWCTGIWNDLQLQSWKEITNFAHSQGAKIAVQLAHAGRKASTKRHQAKSENVDISHGGWQPVAPSPIAFDSLMTPRELDKAEIANLVSNWAAAAGRANLFFLFLIIWC